MEGISADLFKGLLDSGKTNPAVLARKFIEVGGNKELVEKMIENLDPVLFGPELVQIACKAGNFEILKLLLDKGCDINNVPDVIQADDNYRKTPFLIEAASSGSMPTVNMVLDAGASPLDCGFITFSKKKRNLVVSNAIGAAAYNGRHQVMESFIRKLDSECLELASIETPDTRNEKKSKTYVAEMAKYTPLMLAVAGDDKNLECVKTLLKNKANYKVTDQFDNNLLHIAAMNGNNKILEYLGKNLDIEIFARNNKGETPLNIVSAAKNDDGIKILKQFQSDYDQSKNIADQLLEELNAAEAKAAEDKAKKSAKRHRNKVNKIAKTENKTTEQVEKELKEREEQKRREEEEAAKREAELEAKREQEAKMEAQRRREELKKLQLELARQEALERQEAARQKAEEQRARAQEAREREMEKQRIRQEREAARRQRQKDTDQDAAPEKKERVRSVRRIPVDEEPEEQKASETTRTPRHEDKAETRQRANSRAIQRNNSKSVRRDAGEDKGGVTLGGDTFNTGGDGTIFGLTGDIAAKVVGKRAKKTLAQMKKEEEEEEARTKQRMLEKAAERERKKAEDAEAAKKAEEEERKQKKREQEKARRERQKAAKAEKEKAAAAGETLATPEADKKEQDATSKKSAGDKKERTKSARKGKKVADGETPAATPTPEASTAVDESVVSTSDAKKKKAAKAKEDKPKKEYRPKTAVAVEVSTEQPKEESKETSAAAPAEVKQAAAADKTEKAEKPKAAKKKVEKKKDVAAEKSVAASEADQKENQQPPSVNVQPEAAKQAPAKKDAKKGAAKTSVASSSALSTSDEVDKLRQLVLQKETEIHRLEVHLEKKEQKIEEKTKEISQLKDQLTSSAKGDELKQQVSQLTQSLNKQMALNRLQAAQVIELEESLWQANKAKDEAISASNNAPDGPGNDDAALEKARNDVRVKHVQVRDLQAKVDSYQGKASALSFMSKGQLSELQDQLQATLANIALAMEKKS